MPGNKPWLNMISTLQRKGKKYLHETFMQKFKSLQISAKDIWKSILSCLKEQANAIR